MSASVKNQKEKPHSAAPRLAPRQTAASAARAARNATNRNLSLTASQLPAQRSPTRSPMPPVTSKGRIYNQRSAQKGDSKTDLKASKSLMQQETTSHDVITNNQPQNNGPENAISDSVSMVIVDNKLEDQFENVNEIHSQDDRVLSNEDDVIISVEPAIDDTDPTTEHLTRSRPGTPADRLPNSRPQTPKTPSRPETPRLPSRPTTPAHPSQRMDTSLSRPVTPQGRPVTPLGRPVTPQNRPVTPQGRPVTPQGRPVTPQGRPVTPQSRPVTPQTRPVTSQNRPITPQHRLHTPQRQTTVSTKLPSAIPTPVPAKCATPTSVMDPKPAQNTDEYDIRDVFMTKQRQFHRMKKELDLKQQALLEVYDNLRELRERMAQEGIAASGEGLRSQELVVFNVADWAADEISQLCRDAIASSTSDGAVEVINTTAPIDEDTLEELDAKVVDVPSHFANLCLQAFTARQELIDWVKELLQNHEDGRGESLNRIAQYNAQGLELCNELRELKDRADNAVDSVTQLSKRACRERSVLVSVGESLVREVARLRADMEARCIIPKDARDMRDTREIKTETETAKALEEARSELEDEKAGQKYKEKLTITESQLRQARARINKMDRQLREAEASIASLTGTVKSLEDQSRQREVQLEARARKLRETLKTGEVANSQVAQHRDLLQNEVQDLKEQITNMTEQHKATVKDLNNQLKDFKASLQEQHEIAETEAETKQSINTKLMQTQAHVEELKAKIVELENSRPNPELPTEREMELWAELQATKDTLRMTEDEVTSSKREKVRFLETLTKIADSENKQGMQQKLAAELLSKEDLISKMQNQIRELTKNIKLNEQKVIQYEQYVRNLNAHNRAVANCQEAPNGISYQDLQQEIMNLKMGLLEMEHRNEQLNEMLVQKEQQMEQQDKTSRAQARVIKVREELINMLKNKETEQSRELAVLQHDLEHRMKIVEEVNHQIAAKADEIQELFTTLECKQQQIHRLEKIVLALEEQQRRAQAQRTRHEEKIAALEHELAAGGKGRERKFIFF